MDRVQLVLTAELETVTPVPEPDVVIDLTLTNTSEHPVWVNTRFMFDYEQREERELFATIRTPDGRLVLPPEGWDVDQNPLPVERSTFVKLAPDESVDTAVNIAIWHPFTEPGHYDVELTYENTDDGGAFGLRAVVGRFRAKTVRVDIP